MPYKQTPSVMSTVSLDNIALKQINACIIGILCYTIIAEEKEDVMLETFETLDRAAIGKRITEGRKHIKMRRETLAEKLDVSVQFIADVEYGKKGMSMKTFYSICQALDITPNYLLAGSRYSFTGSEEYTRVCEEIAFLLKDCDDKQISAAGDIIRIYADSVKTKESAVCTDEENADS